MYSQTRSQLTGEIYTTENTPVADAVVILKDSLVNTTAYNIVYSDSLGRFSVLAPDACANHCSLVVWDINKLYVLYLQV